MRSTTGFLDEGGLEELDGGLEELDGGFKAPASAGFGNASESVE